MGEQLQANSLVALLSATTDDGDVSVRVALVDAASRFPLGRDAWSRLADVTSEIVASEPFGSPARRDALAVSVRIPLRSLREHLRRMAQDPDEPDRDVVAASLDEAGDPFRVVPILEDARRGGLADFRSLAAMPVEEVITLDDVPLPHGSPSAPYWHALVVARLGEFGPLDAFFSGEAPEPDLFWGSPWTAYDEVARIRPEPALMRAHLLEMLARLDATPAPLQPGHATQRLLRLTVWAATGIADAEGTPLVSAEGQSPVDLPAPPPTPSSDQLNQALAVRAQLPEALFEQRATSPDLDVLTYLPAASVPGLVRDVVAEGNRRAHALTPGADAHSFLGNQIINVIVRCPVAGDWPVAHLVAAQLGAERPALDDLQLAWIVARDHVDHLTEEFTALLMQDRTSGERLRILGLLGAAADCQSGQGGSPYRGSGIGGGGPLLGRGELIDDMPQSAAEAPEDEPQAEVERRTVNARILHDGKRRRTFVGGEDNVIRCWIGLPETDAAAAAEPIPNVSIPTGGLSLTVQLCWRDGSGADHTDSKPMLLPAERTARSGDCDLHIHVPEGERFVGAEVMFRYRGRVFEVVRVEAFVLAPEEAEGPQNELRIRVQASRREVIELADSQLVDATFVFGDDRPRLAQDAAAPAPSSLRIFGGEGGRHFDLADAEVAIRWLNETLFATEKLVVRRRHAAQGPANAEEGSGPREEDVLDADDPDVRKLLRDMARHGAGLYNQLIDQGFTDPGERIQVLNLEPDNDVPLEFVYDGGYPVSEARLCADGLLALKSEGGVCPTCSVSAPETHRGSAPVICPFGFWSLRKIIERVGPGDAGSASAPVLERRSLPVIDSVAFASSHLVPEGERKATREILRQSFARLFLAEDWSQWRKALQEQPSLLLLLPHHGIQDALDYLEIGDQRLSEDLGKLSRAQIDRQYVNLDGRDPGPIVLLLGCQTGAQTETGYVQITRRIQQQHASIVLGTLAQILGRHAAPLARELVAQLVAVDDPQVDFGTIMRRVRRGMLARGYLMALCLVALGDAEWRLTPRPPAGNP